MEHYDNRIDAYIEKSPEFAKPILNYLRAVVHEASPMIIETMKWSMPFFDYKGVVCNMAAFKQHCSFGFWKASLLYDPQKVLSLADQAAGSFGRLTSIDDLPPKEVLIEFIQQAMALNEDNKPRPASQKKSPAQRDELVVPDYFVKFLEAHPQAWLNLNQFSYSQKKEYIEWITEAKTEATRLKRMETAAEWLAEGKSRHWKYK
ncbi:YdeI family protein [Mucilaginibacter sp. Mucisp84]|uniref:YdeI/OmpD-associated family protein n=1 Tax=Mucilaginibacter sp. Mucisp84 TaxID=3243058 RepID=UPI0039A421A8